MGKRLIIKDADFSANAVYPGFPWIDKNCGKVYIIANPANANFGKSGTFSETSGSIYMITARSTGTIEVPNGKKIIVEIVANETGIRQSVLPQALRYPSSWEGTGRYYVVPVSIPAGESQDYSIYFDSNTPATSRFEWVNNTGSTANFMFQFQLDGKPDITAANYTMKYVIVDP